MAIALIIPMILSILLLAAHLLHRSHFVLIPLVLALPILIKIHRTWVLRFIQLVLVFAALEWVRSLFEIRALRIDNDQPWLGMAIILGAVAAWTFISALLLFLPQVKRRFGSSTLPQPA